MTFLTPVEAYTCVGTYILICTPYCNYAYWVIYQYIYWVTYVVTCILYWRTYWVIYDDLYWRTYSPDLVILTIWNLSLRNLKSLSEPQLRLSSLSW